MIITRTPLRISFAGGGTDLPSFYRKESGAVVSTTINKYVYIFAHPYFDDRILLKYSNSELVNEISQIKMSVFRESLRLYGIDKKIEIGLVADIPKEGGSGLGGSTAFSVGLLNALAHHSGNLKSKTELAEQSSDLEINILGNPIGKQDQYASAVGGLNYIQFNPDETVNVDPIYMDPDVLKELDRRLLMFYTGITRKAIDILAEQQKKAANEDDKFKAHQKMRDFAIKLRDQLKSNYINDFGKILHENWLLKKTLTEGISSKEIDQWYERALDSGAEGGKILGAGGGGFLLFYCPTEKQRRLRSSLSDLKEYPFKFEPEGTKVILYDQNMQNIKRI